MKIATLNKDGSESRVVELDQETLSVVEARDEYAGEWVDEIDWKTNGGGIILGPTHRNSDGLVYRLVIEVIDWWSATGEGRHFYHVNLSGVSGDDFAALDATGIRDVDFDTRQEAESVLRQSCEDEGVELDDAEIFHMIDEDERPTHVACLYVVPVSVPRDVVVSCLGCLDDDETMKWVDDCRRKDGDYRAVAADISRCGHHVPIPVDGTNGLRFLDEDGEEVFKKLRAQARAVEGLFGFFMDRPVNQMGESGWDWLRHARAFPGQQQGHESGDWQTVDEDGEKLTCYDCGEEAPCKLSETIYQPSGVWICGPCHEDYYTCAGPDCGLLIPIQPQSYAGVEWTRVEDNFYCEHCVDALYQGPDCPGTVVGGTRLEERDVAGLSQQLSHVAMGDWDLVDSWSVGWYGNNVSEETVFEAIVEAVEEAGDDVEFIFGVTSHEQFQVHIGLYRRDRNGKREG